MLSARAWCKIFTMPEHYDIAIVGSGIVGAAMAASLADSHLNIVLIDPGQYSSEPLPDAYDIRVSAITIASQRLFESLGVWEDIQSHRASAFTRMHVWEQVSGAAIDFDGEQMGEDLLGHIIENRVIQYYLLKKIRAATNITFLDQSRIKSFNVQEDGRLELLLDDKQRCVCQLMIGADGNQSRVRALAGIETRGWQYQQSALVATVRTEKSHQQTAWQCFLEHGPLAFLPLQDNVCSIVWSTLPELADELMQMPEAQFEEALTDAFEHRLGAIKLEGQRAVFPLQLQYVDHYVKPGIALIGDAAHSIHPLAGQGVNLGLLDAACLADVILEADKLGKSPGAYGVLRRYERWRKGDNMGMMMTMDAFKRLFTTQSVPLKLIRDNGIRIVDTLQPLKAMVMKSAAGMRGELPALIRRGVKGTFK